MANWSRQAYPTGPGLTSDTNPIPTIASKHQRWVLCPLDGKFYIFGGDYASEWEGAPNQSGIGAFISYDPVAVKWEMAYPYWGIAGEHYPQHPDEVGVCWDSKRHLFWLTNGYQGGVTSRDIANVVGIQTRGIVQAFDPLTRHWLLPHGMLAFAYGQYGRSVYDPVKDLIYGPYYNGAFGTAVKTFNPETGEAADWQVTGIGNVFPSNGQTVHLIGRNLYFFDGTALYRVNVDSATPAGNKSAVAGLKVGEIGPMYGDQDNSYIPELDAFLVWTETPPMAHLVDRVTGVVTDGPESPPLLNGQGYRPQHNNRHPSGVIVIGWSASEAAAAGLPNEYWHYSLTDVEPPPPPPPPPPPENGMKNIVATITTSQQNFPAGTVAQNYRFEISGPRNEFQDVAYGGALSATFTDVPDGTYTVTAELLDSGGNRLGNLLSQQVTVTTAPADIILSVPAGLTVQVITV